MPRNKSNQSRDLNKTNSVENASQKSQHNNSSYQIYLWSSFLLGMISLGIVIWNRSSVTSSNVKDHLGNSPFILVQTGLRSQLSEFMDFGLGKNDNSVSLLSSALSSTQGVIVQSGTVNDQTGWCVATAGDINGDGISDFLVGTPGASLGGRSGAGAVYLIFGSTNISATLNLANLSSIQGVILQGGAAGDGVGTSIAAASDLDGVADILVGAKGVQNLNGAAYLVYGQPASRTPAATQQTSPLSTTPLLPLSTMLSYTGVSSQITGATLSFMSSASGRDTPSTIPAGKTITTNNSTSAIVGGIVGNVVVLGAALAAFGFWRKKRNTKSYNPVADKLPENRYTNTQSNNYSNHDVVVLRSTHYSNEKLGSPNTTTQPINQLSPKVASYAKRDETKETEWQYDNPSKIMGDDLRMMPLQSLYPNSQLSPNIASYAKRDETKKMERHYDNPPMAMVGDLRIRK